MALMETKRFSLTKRVTHETKQTSHSPVLRREIRPPYSFKLSFILVRCDRLFVFVDIKLTLMLFMQRRPGRNSLCRLRCRSIYSVNHLQNQKTPYDIDEGAVGVIKLQSNAL